MADPRLRRVDPTLERFARRLRTELSAERVLLFGSHACGTPQPDSDYDLIVVAERFAAQPRLKRSTGLRDIFYAAGGHAPLDLVCLTPAEFDRARQQITLVSAVLPETIDLLEPAIVD